MPRKRRKRRPKRKSTRRWMRSRHPISPESPPPGRPRRQGKPGAIFRPPTCRRPLRRPPRSRPVKRPRSSPPRKYRRCPAGVGRQWRQRCRDQRLHGSKSAERVTGGTGRTAGGRLLRRLHVRRLRHPACAARLRRRARRQGASPVSRRRLTDIRNTGQASVTVRRAWPFQGDAGTSPVEFVGGRGVAGGVSKALQAGFPCAGPGQPLPGQSRFPNRPQLRLAQVMESFTIPTLPSVIRYREAVPACRHRRDNGVGFGMRRDDLLFQSRAGILEPRLFPREDDPGTGAGGGENHGEPKEFE